MAEATTADGAALPARPAPARSAAADESPVGLKGRALVFTAAAIAIGTFMQVLDTTIANVSIPTISGNLGVSSSQGTWVITSFAVANGVSVPLTGWLMGRYGAVKTFVASVALFTIASLLCGLSWNLPSLIFFRVLQGAVSGPMIPGSQALLLMIFPASKRATALAIWSMTTLVAPVCGPVLGGYISDNMSWPWIFFINLPIGLFCAFVCWRNLASVKTPTRQLPIDKMGFALLVLWVGTLQIMLDTGKDADWFSSPLIVAELVIAVVGVAAFVIWEITAKFPIVDLTLYKSSNFAIAGLVFCIGYGVFFGANVLQPLWLQTQMGYNATWAGATSIPAGIVAVLFTPIAARLVNRFDARWTATLSLLAFGLSFYMRSEYTTQISFMSLVWPALVQGVGMSTFFLGMITISLNGIPPSSVPMASGLTNFARITAGSFAASLVTTVWERGATLHQTRLVEVAGQGDPIVSQAMTQLQAHGFTAAQATGAFAQQLGAQAIMLATVDYFRLLAIMMVLLIVPVWFTRRTTSSGGGAPVAAD